MNTYDRIIEFESVLKRWRIDAKIPTSQYQASKGVLNSFKNKIGKSPIDANTSDVSLFLDREDITKTTVTYYRSVLVRFFAYLVSKNIREDNPMPNSSMKVSKAIGSIMDEISTKDMSINLTLPIGQTTISFDGKNLVIRNSA